MPTIFSHLPANLGIYTLTRFLGEREQTELYLATQSHVERGVVIEVLKPGAGPEEMENFLNTARARGSASLPHVSQVYESMVTDGMWYLTLERPKGKNLSQMAASGERLQHTQQACGIISAAAELYEAAARQGLAAGGLPGDAVFYSRDGSCTFLSPVLAGTPDPASVPAQMAALAHALEKVVAQGVPGQNRLSTLLHWMQEGYEGEYLDWASAAGTAGLICEQLTPVLDKSVLNRRITLTTGAKKRQHLRHRRKLLRAVAVGILITAFIIAMAVLGNLFLSSESEELQPDDGKYIACKQGQTTKRLLSRPVSIGEYDAFLSALTQSSTPLPTLARIHKGIPQDAQKYLPAEWDSQSKCARRGKKWHGEKLSLSSPVRGVSYWDSLAYANYMKGSLPDAKMLQAARRELQSKEGEGVEEWTASVSSAEPLYEKGRIILPADSGASPLIEPDPTARNIRRGFRILLP